MRKALVLTLAFWAGISNFAYASARIECAAMMQRASCHVMTQSGAKSDPCPCKIQAPTDHRALQDVFVLKTDGSSVLLDVPAVVSELRSAAAAISPGHGPPSGPSLYRLFSVYRI